MEQELKQAALDYHRLPTPGKISLTPTKALANQRDLSLAYSPGVAYACMAIKDDPLQAARADRASQPRRRSHERHSCPGSWQHRAAGGQARDGRQRLPIQEIRWYRRV